MCALAILFLVLNCVSQSISDPQYVQQDEEKPDFRTFQGPNIIIQEQNITFTICLDLEIDSFDIFIPQKNGFSQTLTINTTSNQCNQYNIVTTPDKITIMKNLEIVEIVSIDSPVTKFVVKSSSNTTKYKIPTVCTTGNEHHRCEVNCPPNWCEEYDDCSKEKFYSDFVWLFQVGNCLLILIIILSIAIMIILCLYRDVPNQQTRIPDIDV